jgi:RNA polymerase sigma-54 factor
MKQSLQLRTSQHLALTPQLQQSIRLLQLSTLELHQELEQLLTDNPLLERLDDPLDRSVRLLGDGAINTAQATPEAPAEPAQAENAAPADAEPYESGASEGGEGEHDWSDVSRGKGPDDDDARPQLEASHGSLRDHLMEQMRVTVQEPRDRALIATVR